MASTQVILLERVEKLGQMGDIVTVKPGFARNFLLPQNKALRASKGNIAYFEAEKKALMADNDKKMKDAQKHAKTFENIKVSLIRQASESGQLFGSVTSRDIAQSVAEQTGEAITKDMISINRNFKMIGLFPVDIYLHPEVKVDVIINIARSPEEAEIQAKTGKALVAEAEQDAPAEDTAIEEAEAALEDVLDDSALEIEKEKAEAAEEDAKKQVESDEKSAARQAKKAEKKADEDAEAEASAEDAAPAEEAAAEDSAEEKKEDE